MDGGRIARRRMLRGVSGAAGLIGTSALAGCLGYVRSSRVDGLVTAKSIIGLRDDVPHQVLVAHDVALLVKDERFETAFTDRYHVVVDQEFHRQLELAYWDGITYQVQFQLLGDDAINRVTAPEAWWYVSSRERFNEVQVGNEVSFDVSRNETLTVRRYRRIEKKER